MATETGGHHIGCHFGHFADPRLIDHFFHDFFHHRGGGRDRPWGDDDSHGHGPRGDHWDRDFPWFGPRDHHGPRGGRDRDDDDGYGWGRDDRGGHHSSHGGGSSGVQVAGSGDDTVDGGPCADTLLGGSGSVSLNGGSGNDTLIGGSGNSSLNGESGNDTLISGSGDEYLVGGQGNDTFVFAADRTGDDVIVDFRKGDILQIADRNGDGYVKAEGACADFSVAQSGADTVITFANGDSVTLKNVDADDLQEDCRQDGIFKLH